MFETRKAIFVDILKWNVPVIDGRFEVDQYDNERACYVLVNDELGKHLGSARLLPTTGPHILGDLYPELCANGVPRGSRTFEITRFCLGLRGGARLRLATRNRLVSALVTIALERGIERFTGVAEMGWLQQILAFGWDCSPLGPPRQIGRSMLGALVIEISPRTPQLLAENGIWAFEVEPMAQAA